METCRRFIAFAWCWKEGEATAQEGGLGGRPDVNTCATMCNGMPGREGKRGLTRRTGSFKTVALLMLIPVGGIILIFLWSFLHNALSLLHREPHSEASVLATTVPHRGDIVLILDDVRFDHQPLT